MQENHVACTDAEHHTRDSITAQRRSYLVETSAHWPTGWHSNRPSVFDGPDVGANQPSIIAGHLLKPLTDGFVSGFGFEEGGWNPFE
jgi:hypothetical protein